MGIDSKFMKANFCGAFDKVNKLSLKDLKGLDKGVLKLSEALSTVTKAVVCEVDGKILSEASKRFIIFISF
jgi:hypothetical protein